MRNKTFLSMVSALTALCLLTACHTQGSTTPESEIKETTTSTKATIGSTSARSTATTVRTTAGSGGTEASAEGSGSLTAATKGPSASPSGSVGKSTSSTVRVATTSVRATTTTTTTTTKRPTTTTAPPVSGNAALKLLADQAYADILGNFWTGSAQSGHLRKTSHGYPIPSSTKMEMIWEHATMVFAMDTYYSLTKDPAARDRIVAEWQFIKANFTRAELITPGRAPNIAIDDSGWDAMALMVFYKYSGDRYALEAAGDLIRNAYDYWKDGEVGNGLWYPQNPPSQGNTDTSIRFKSIAMVGLMTASFDYAEATGAQDVFDDMMDAYGWIEEHLLRDGEKKYPDFTVNCHDHLYFCDYNEGRTGRGESTGPDGGRRTNDIREAGSVSALFGNMAMGALHARLYRRTGERRYLDRALETVRAIGDGVYNQQGVLLNDRDAWANGAFFKTWVEDVLVLPGVQQKDKDLVYNTARSIYNRARTEQGYYSGSWSGSSRWEEVGSVPEQIMTSGTSVNVIMAAALLESMEGAR